MTVDAPTMESFLQTSPTAVAEILWSCPIPLRKPVLRLLDALSSRASDVDLVVGDSGRFTLHTEHTMLGVSDAMVIYANWMRSGRRWTGQAPTVRVTAQGFTVNGGQFDLRQDRHGTTIQVNIAA